MIDVVQADASRSTGIDRSTVSGVVQDWLDEHDLRGADVIRARVALLIAAQLDADPPPYVVPEADGGTAVDDRGNRRSAAS